MRQTTHCVLSASAISFLSLSVKMATLSKLLLGGPGFLPIVLRTHLQHEAQSLGEFSSAQYALAAVAVLASGGCRWHPRWRCYINNAMNTHRAIGHERTLYTHNTCSACMYILVKYHRDYNYRACDGFHINPGIKKTIIIEFRGLFTRTRFFLTSEI